MKIRFAEEIEYIAKSHTPIFFPHLLKIFYKKDISKKAYEMRLRRYLKKLESQGFLTLKKVDGLIQITPKPKLVYLINRRESFTKNVTFRRISFERIQAIRLAQNINMLDSQTKDEIKRWFSDYLERINESRIILVPKEEFSEVLFPKILPYRTRFNSKVLKKKNLIKYARIFRYAGEKFKYAVFLTLTTNPYLFKNLYSSYKASYYAWNRFRYYVKKWVGKKPYILVHEFTKSGLLHIHLVIFGIKRLEDVYNISKKWEDVGLGKIVYVYSLVNRSGNFVWRKDKPKNARSSNIMSYLKKYLVKALQSEDQLFLYWLSGKRFFTYSKDFLFIVKEKKIIATGYYVYFGTFSLMFIPFWLYQIGIDYG